MHVRLVISDNGYFFAQGRSVGLGDDELKALERGDACITDERKETIAFLVNEAMHRLSNRVSEGRA